MPYINIKTNTDVSKEAELTLKTAFGEAITKIPGKSEQWLMVGVEPGSHLYFKGSEEPAAMVEVSIFGQTTDDAYDALTKELCAVITTHLEIPANRTYIKYSEIDHWGWNHQNF